MSLNKLSSDLEIKEWMHVGANTIKCNSLDTAELKVDGAVIQPVLLKFSSRGGSVTGNIFPGPSIFVNNISPGIGSMDLTFAFEANRELRIVTLGQINSTAVSNVISYKINDTGVQVDSHNLSSTSWLPFDSVRFESIYVFTSPTQAKAFANYTANDGHMINYSTGTVTFQSGSNHMIDVALSATSACDFSWYQTTVTYA